MTRLYLGLVVMASLGPSARAAETAAKIKLSPIVTDGITDPVHLAFAPGEKDRLYVVEQAGRIVVIEKGKLLPKPFFDIRDKVRSGGEMGLLSVAFHPAYAKNHRFFVNYTSPVVENAPGKHFASTSITAEYEAGKDTEKVLFKIPHPYTNHNGGQLAFDAKGYLYLGMGDGGGAGDRQGNGQNKESWLGKIHRVDVDHGSPYAIPDDNPFAKGGGRKEVFAYGLRNPWRFSFDRLTGALFAADVGQDLWEEIDIVENGKNYGWNVMEGFHCFKPRKGCKTEGLVLPIHEYGHDDGISITGGFVYRGKKIPALEGVYVYADYGSGKIWGLTYDQKAKKKVKNELLLNSNLPVTTFGEDPDGELYLAAYQGMIYRIDPK